MLHLLNRQVFQKIAVVIKTRSRMIAHVYFKMPKTHKLDIIGSALYSIFAFMNIGVGNLN